MLSAQADRLVIAHRQAAAEFIAHCRCKENTECVSAGWAIRWLLVTAAGGSCASATPRKVGRAVAGVGWCSPARGHIGDPLPVQRFATTGHAVLTQG
ncbi:hypothetical protein [Rhodococcus erythropolis]|uniref:hypothetical protein n=1 Tax=Rhodococcus erythropolis TaxID=1833 RepID=UPI001BE68D5B|nr:hypothetical protein [Rhodococcus erythropolis]MBT2263563.1 hypothetical protein [Rhodococcus erythropolis]